MAMVDSFYESDIEEGRDLRGDEAARGDLVVNGNECRVNSNE